MPHKIKIMKYKISLLFLLFTTYAIAQDSIIKTLDDIVESKIGENDPALMVGVIKDGEIIYEKYRGMANLQHQVRADYRTKSNIASTAKQFTSLMVLQLSLQKKLSLEDDIRKYLPALYPKVKEKIKIRHLINHTSGIRDYSDLLSLKRKPWWRQVGMDNDDVLELIKKQEELAFLPGKRDMYSNSGYILLTKIIEKVSGQKFYDFSKNFFESMGMKDTEFSRSYMRVVPNLAQPYSDWGDGVWKEYPMLTRLNGDGFLYTTLKDQLHYELAIQNANGDDSLFYMSQQPIPGSEIKSYGFGLELGSRLNRTAVHHSGATGSYHSQTLRFPKEKLSVFVMSSNSRIWSGFIADEIASVFLDEVEKSPEYSEELTQSKISDESLVLGQYRSPGGYLIRIEKEDNKILWKNANNRPDELIVENNTLIFKSKPSMKIGFYPNKMVRFAPNGKKLTYNRDPHKPASFSDLESFVGKYYSSELEIEFEIKKNNKGELGILLPQENELEKLEVLNRDELLVWDYILKIQRDSFNRVTDILVTTNRILNNRFKKQTHLKYQPKIATQGGSIQVTTIGSHNQGGSTILLTKNLPNGNEIWSRRFGGNSYDKASSIIETNDGYLIIGSTSSYGVGNYDMFVIKTDKKGNKLWQNTYGEFDNDYGYTAEIVADGYIIKGSTQRCNSKDVLNRKCSVNVWFVTIDKNGREISNKILEEL